MFVVEEFILEQNKPYRSELQVHSENVDKGNKNIT